MAKRRVHEIAKERGITSKELLAALHAAGVEAKAAQSSVDEADAARALGANGGSAAPAKPKAQAPAKPKAQAKADGDAAPAKAKGDAAPAKAKADAAPKATPKPAAAPAKSPSQAPQPQGTAARGGKPGEGPAAADAPQAPRPAPRAGSPTAPPGRKPGTGPRVLQEAQPTPPPQPRGQDGPRDGGGPPRDGDRKRPTRPGSSGGGAPGGRRRVIIDSQAARRPQTPPPQQQPPRRRRGRRRLTPLEEPPPTPAEPVVVEEPPVPIQSGATVKEVAESLDLSAAEVIKKLMQLGEMATLTQTLTEEAIQVLADEFDKKVEFVHSEDEVASDEIEFDDSDEDLSYRPPVVTIMGHVDHGKTSLLDAIRETEVAAGEAGGITQHIGAYQVHHDGSTITFIDTPGHQAFTAMRARGAKVTDIAVIVVAADDGVMPQTVEAIDHAKAAGVPIMVAVNKIDKEGADPNRVRGELANTGLTPSDWGGDTEFVDVSAKTRDGLENLLETVVTLAELQELKANPDAEASGPIIESRLDPGRGPVATMLVLRGRLKTGDALVAGAAWAKVRAMQDFKGQRLGDATPGMPVEILGFESVPDAGEMARVVENERKARQLANERAERLKREALARRGRVRVSLEDVFARAQRGEAKQLALIVKSDVAGSLEALEDEIAKLPQQEIQVQVIHDGVGGINESDVMLAAASDAIIIGFNVRPVGSAAEVARREGVEIRHYSVIYNVVDELRQAMQGLLEPEEVEKVVATVEVREVFKASRVGTIAGSYVVDGTVRRGATCRLVRDGTVIYDGRINTLRRFKDDVREVQAGFECGITLENYADEKVGDVIEIYEKQQVERELS